MKNNDHKKRTFIDRFARHYYCQHARLGTLRMDKHVAIKKERAYQKSLCKSA